MCGRYFLFSDNEMSEIISIVKQAEQNSKLEIKTGEIFPTNIAPVLIKQQNNIKPFAMQWGFPKFDGKGVIINARSETAATKPTFAKSLMLRRCLIPTTGFYEWKTEEDKKKSKYLFTVPNNEILYLAGIYNTFKDVDCFTILTASPNKYIDDVHNRMPVVLDKNEYSCWLNNEVDLPKIFNRSNIILERKMVG